MPIWLGILVGVVALVAGVALGFFIARKYMMNYLQKNPPINEQMLKMMMMQMGQKTFPKENQSNDERNEQATNEISAKRHSLRVSFFFVSYSF